MNDGGPPKFLLLGAEQQAATSLALAYPERRFLFASDEWIVDGWDLPNVEIIHAKREAAATLHSPADQVMPLSARWLADPAAVALSAVLPRIAAALPAHVLSVHAHPGPWRAVIAKGDLWHRPDIPIVGKPDEFSDIDDQHGCGLVYQERVEAQGCVMAIGRRSESGAAVVGLLRAFSERFFRIDVLQAAEAVEIPELAELSRSALRVLDHVGWFTLNWLLTDEGPRLSSFRPVPKAAFGCFRRGGIDMLSPVLRDANLPAGLRLIAMPHYASFKMLEPR